MLQTLLLLAFQLQCSSGKRVNTKMVEVHLQNLADGALSRSATDNATMNDYSDRFRQTFRIAQDTPLLIAQKITKKFYGTTDGHLREYQAGWDTSFAKNWKEVTGLLLEAAEAVGEYYAALIANRGNYGGRKLGNGKKQPEKYESCQAEIEQSAYLKVLNIFAKTVEWQQNGVNTETVSLSLDKYLAKAKENRSEYLDTLESFFKNELGADFVLDRSLPASPDDGRFIRLWAEVFRLKTIAFSKDLGQGRYSSAEHAIAFEKHWLSSEELKLDGCKFGWGCGRISGGKDRKRPEGQIDCKCAKNFVLGNCPSGQDFEPGSRFYSRTTTMSFTNAEVADCRCVRTE